MTAIDQNKANDFAGRVLGDGAALMTCALAYLGDQLGLWKDMDVNGPATSEALARRNGLSERHVREWLAGMAAAGYLQYDPAARSFALPPEHAMALAHEGGPMFFGGALQITLGYLTVLDRVKETFRTGGGVPQSGYPDATYEGMERFSAGWYEHLLVPAWLPAAGVADRLEDGIDVADVGCGRGRAVIKMAQAFPQSRFVGYDVYGPNIQLARSRAAEAGVSDRVTFSQVDASDRLPRQFDLITTFDVVHDAVDPAGMLGTIRRALREDGAYVCVDINCSHRLEDNIGPLGALMHGVSVMYCLSTSLAHGGAGLGTCGLHEPKLREMATAAGYGSVRRVDIDNPFNNLYVLSPAAG